MAKPLLLMVATLVLLLFHVKVTPLMALPLLSFAVAVNCCVAPTAMEGEAGDTVMVEMVDLEPPEEELDEPPPQPARTQAKARRKTDAARERARNASKQLGNMGPPSQVESCVSWNSEAGAEGQRINFRTGSVQVT